MHNCFGCLRNFGLLSLYSIPAVKEEKIDNWGDIDSTKESSHDHLPWGNCYHWATSALCYRVTVASLWKFTAASVWPRPGYKSQLPGWGHNTFRWIIMWCGVVYTLVWWAVVYSVLWYDIVCIVLWCDIVCTLWCCVVCNWVRYSLYFSEVWSSLYLNVVWCSL